MYAPTASFLMCVEPKLRVLVPWMLFLETHQADLPAKTKLNAFQMGMKETQNKGKRL